MVDIDRNLECYFTIVAGLTGVFLIIIAAIITPNYSPLTHTISELAYYRYKTLFSIGMVVIGNSMIPFFFKLERELVNLKESLRVTATVLSIFTAICISLVGIIPDMEYYDQFIFFHMFVAIVAFGCSSIYIVMYSRLIQKAIQTPSYKGPQFRRFMTYYGYDIFLLFITLIIVLNCIIEWILFINVIAWNIITAFYLTRIKFSGMPGLYYTKDQYPEMLTQFEDSLEILKTLNLEDSPEAESLKKNILRLKCI